MIFIISSPSLSPDCFLTCFVLRDTTSLIKLVIKGERLSAVNYHVRAALSYFQKWPKTIGVTDSKIKQSYAQTARCQTVFANIIKVYWRKIWSWWQFGSNLSRYEPFCLQASMDNSCAYLQTCQLHWDPSGVKQNLSPHSLSQRGWDRERPGLSLG